MNEFVFAHMVRDYLTCNSETKMLLTISILVLPVGLVSESFPSLGVKMLTLSSPWVRTDLHSKLNDYKIKCKLQIFNPFSVSFYLFLNNWIKDWDY